MEKDYHYIGKALSNDGVYGKVTGSAEYCSDMESVGMLHMKCKAGEVSHGMITRIDSEEAWKVPGVRAIYTWENTPNRYFDRGRVSLTEADNAPNQERLFDRHIRFYGERVAAVVAESVEDAEEACNKIKVEYEELPLAVSMEAAMQPDAPQLHTSGNVYETQTSYGDYGGVQSECKYQTRVHIGRMTHLSMETQCVRACYSKSERKLTVWTGTQTVYGARATIAEFLDMPFSKVRVIKPLMGGSFGCKQEMILEPLVSYVAKDLQADVKFVYTREEQIVNAMLKHSLDGQIESKVDREGTIQGISLDVCMDSGAYQTISPSYLRTIGGKLGKVYKMKNINYHGRAVCTTTPVNGSFRSWGSSEATMLVESHWNYVAKQLGMDPVEFRLKNHLQYGDREVLHGASVGEVRFEECLRQGSERFQWQERKAACAKKNQKKGRYRYGVGMALCSHTTSFYPYQTEVASAAARIQDDGSLVVHVPIHDHGCGTVMAMKKIAAEILQVKLDRITLNEADTENMPYDYGCYASRTVYTLGRAVKECCEKLLGKAKMVAAAQLGCADNTILYENGEFFSEPNLDRRLNLHEVWKYSVFTMGKDLYEMCTTNANGNPGTAGAHFTQVKVDTYTGAVEIEHCLSVHDVGRAINPDMCRGQIGSGIQQGIGMALREEIKIDPITGRALITNFKNYEVMNAADMPDYDSLLIEEEEETGPFGAKGIGEIVLAPIAPALVEAVNQALGTELTTLPLTPPVILEAIKEVE
ncbi:MAG: xanthine dehydrogenase family protein molybdopterin-binding subunit [Lachnospiraceae bacterium]|nr:xanthine dehydrogenase family protein molybdopterin-binding subunit [Lachnospiraceae bacterium]MDD3615413.1 xanthine dehydrogenase family protein molybdopterin-binding subunit [Lachnospiraceae bacterium]